MKIVEQSVTLIDHMGSDLSVVNAARVSFHKESEYESVVAESETETKVLRDADQRLIRYLARHGHWTPFGHAFLSFRIKTPFFVARQLGKHQVGLVWNEVSRRYVDDEPEFWLPKVFHRRPDGSVKQGSGVELDPYDSQQWLIEVREQTARALVTYNGMIEDGIAPEEARIVLPFNTMTEYIWSGSIAAFGRVVRQRTDGHAQKATGDLVRMIGSALPKEFEHSWKALLE